MFQTLQGFIVFMFNWAPSPLNWIFSALVGIAIFLAIKKVLVFILDLIPFL